VQLTKKSLKRGASSKPIGADDRTSGNREKDIGPEENAHGEPSTKAT